MHLENSRRTAALSRLSCRESCSRLEAASIVGAEFNHSRTEKEKSAFKAARHCGRCQSTYCFNSFTTRSAASVICL